MAKASATITVTMERDISSVTRYYKLQASTASVPAKPTTLNPTGWITTEPTYTEGSTNSLYTTDCTVFTDGTFSYSDVSLSSSYEAAKAAYNKAATAQQIAENTNQYFWYAQSGSDTGAHITERPQNEFLADPDNGGGNLLARSNGIIVRKGLNELAKFDENGVTIGNAGGMFGIDSVFSRVDTSLSGGALYVKYGRTFKTLIAIGNTNRFALGGFMISKHPNDYTITIDGTPVTSGYTFEDTSQGTFVVFDNAPSGEMTIKYYDARKSYAAVGTNTGGDLAGGDCFVIGYGDTRGNGSFAQGRFNIAYNDYSSAHGLYTHATADAQAVFGKYNEEDANALFVVGNGDSNARSNAFTVDNNGNVNGAGNVSAGGNMNASGNITAAGDMTAHGSISTDGTVTASGGYSDIVEYEDVEVLISYAAGTIGSRGATASLGTTVKANHTYIGAYIVDNRNTSIFNATIQGNGPNNTAHLCVYRATGNAVSNASVTARKVWLKTGGT